MSRLWSNVSHISIATRISSGTATAGIRCGSYDDGQLIVHVTGLGGSGAFLVPYWQSSADGTAWGDLLKGATLTATGVGIVAPLVSIGQWARGRWVQSATAVKFAMTYVLKE